VSTVVDGVDCRRHCTIVSIVVDSNTKVHASLWAVVTHSHLHTCATLDSALWVIKHRPQPFSSLVAGCLCPLSWCSMIPQQLNSLVVLGWSLSSALSLSVERSLDVVELWSGVGSIVQAARSKHLSATPFDKYRNPHKSDTSEDILTPSGFRAALLLVLALKEGGLLWLAPVCSSWVWLNSSRTRRSVANPDGDESYPPVVEGNLHAKVAAFLYALAHLRNCTPVLENPQGSLIFEYWPVKRAIASFATGRAICCRCRFSTERIGERHRKPYKLVGGTWVTDSLSFPCRCPRHCGLVRRLWKG
jgi:hypothetical protein